MTSPYQKHRDWWKDCQRCPLGKQRSRIVLARGRVPCDVLFIGEAPGVSEDALGQPFIGPAGKLLDRIVDDALDPIFMGSDRPKVVFTNLVACFPKLAKSEGVNHQPAEAEIKACSTRLKEFVDEVARPRLIVCVGALSEKWVPQFIDPFSVEMIHIVHPAAILRAPDAQRGLMVRRCVVVLANAVEALHAED